MRGSRKVTSKRTESARQSAPGPSRDGLNIAGDKSARNTKLGAEMATLGLEWENGNKAVTLFDDGQPIATGHGSSRSAALHDLWITLRDRGASEHHQRHVEDAYRVMTNSTRIAEHKG